ncbi:hypothetical protein [Lutibacter sp.]|uniref:hypothetical protein n=1 Tax=Lutibacter sp. TaxID=1925666 RepID=UPI00273438E1|nr:hypothetical protein [Lutibacter sp.]MDP3312165.1 hypothetical protein [Lutibacter sp.]
MKHLLIKFAALFFVLSLSLSACSSNDDGAITNDIVKIKIETNVKSGTFRITKFIDSGKDETTHFTGYNFTFGPSNVLTATNGTNTYTGTWSITNSSSSSSGSQNDLDFNIMFTSPPDFEELSDDWDFISQTSSKIELIDISGGNGGTDYLTFQKN